MQNIHFGIDMLLSIVLSNWSLMQVEIKQLALDPCLQCKVAWKQFHAVHSSQIPIAKDGKASTSVEINHIFIPARITAAKRTDFSPCYLGFL